MGDVAKSVHNSQRDVTIIDDEESTNDNPFVKRETEPFADLQQKVCELEEMYESFCRATSEIEIRTESPENLLDCKREAIDGKEKESEKVAELENKLAEVTSRLEAAKRRAENVFTRKIELARENETLRTELNQMRRAARKMHGESEVNELHERLSEMSLQLEEERRKVSELTRQNADLEMALAARDKGGPQPLMQLQQPAPQLHEIGHPTNIYQLCRPDSRDSMSIDTAREKLFSVIENIDGENLLDKLKKCFTRFPELDMILRCEVCKETKPTHRFIGIIVHFLSIGHCRQVCAVDAAVSRAAVEYWLDKLQSQPAESLKQPSAATAYLNDDSPRERFEEGLY